MLITQLVYQVAANFTRSTSLVPRLLCGGGGKRAWYTLFAHVPSSLGNLHTTPLQLKLWSIFAYLLKATLHSYTPCGTHTSDFEVKNNIVLTVTFCIALFEVIGELQTERLHQSCAEALSWNG